MRELTSHKVSGLNEALRIEVLDEPGQGNACHRYRIRSAEIPPPPEADVAKCRRLLGVSCDVNFQNGPIQEAGVHGVSNEALLAIVEDRLVGFQGGEYACGLNAAALHYVRAAMGCLRARTEGRVARGVEGTSQK